MPATASSMAACAASNATAGSCAPVQMAADASPTGPHCADENGDGDIGTPRFRAAPNQTTAANEDTSASFNAPVEAGIVLLTKAIFF